MAMLGSVVNLCCRKPRHAQKIKLDAELAHHQWAQHQEQLAEEEAELQRAAEQKWRRSGAVAATCYPLLGALFLGLFLWTCLDYAFLPLQLSNAAWARRWFLVAAADNLTVAQSLVGIALASENWLQGIIWSLLILTVGAPAACLYMIIRVFQHQTLAMVSVRDERYVAFESSNTDSVVGYTTGFYAVAGLAFLTRLLWTLFYYPAFPMRRESPDWNCEWLITAVAGLCTEAICLCGVILSTEGTAFGLLWSLPVLLLGGPGACLYMTYRAAWHEAISLQTRASEW